MMHHLLASSIFSIDLSDFWRSFLMFVAAYFGTKHGASNGNSNGSH